MPDEPNNANDHEKPLPHSENAIPSNEGIARSGQQRDIDQNVQTAEANPTVEPAENASEISLCRGADGHEGTSGVHPAREASSNEANQTDSAKCKIEDNADIQTAERIRNDGETHPYPSATMELVDAFHDELLAKGNDPDHSDEKDEERSTFIPSPAIDLVRYEYTDGSQQVCVALFESDCTSHCGSYRDYGGHRYYVPQLPPGVYESMLLPQGVRKYGSTRDLFERIQRLLKSRLMLSERQAAVLTHWCIASWFSDVLEFVPRLTITGPRYAADLLFRVLRCACRRPLLLSGLNAAALKLIPINELMPTLFIRETRRTRRKDDLLDAGDHRGYFVASGSRMHQCYCARCVYFGEEFVPTQFLEGIHIHVARNAFLPDRPLPDEDIQELQDELFLYRNFNRDLVAASRFAPTGLAPELCAVARQLGKVIVDDTELQSRIIGLLQYQNEQALADRSTGLKGVVLRALLLHCHKNDEQVLSGQIAATVNEIYREEGESSKVKSETVGHVLKSLGLYSCRLSSSGRGLRLDRPTQRQAHELSLAYGVLPFVPDCGFCHRIQTPELEALM